MREAGEDMHVDVTVDAAWTLESILGEDMYGITSLTIAGPIDSTDFVTMRKCCTYGKLEVID